MKRFAMSLIVAVAVTLCVASAANATVITNGDFETPVITGNFQVVNTGYSFGNSSEWEFGFGSSYDGGVVWKSPTYGPVPQGNQCVSLNEPGGIGCMYQDLACSPNTTYTATFLFTGLSDYNGTASSTFGLFVAAADPIGGGSRGSSPTFTVGMGTTPNLSMPAATLKSFTFTTGSETTERLCFFSTAASSVAPGNYYGPVVDDIRVTVAPEPCTIGMTVVALIGLLAYAWWQRRRFGGSFILEPRARTPNVTTCRSSLGQRNDLSDLLEHTSR